MAITKVSGNQIATSTEAIIATLSFVNTNSVFRMPAGTQAQRPTGVSVGTIRFNSDTDSAEIYKADDGTGSPGWSPVSGGGPALGTDSIVRTNPNTNNDAKFANGMSAGPITIANGFTVTIEAGGAWSVV